jgi:hypothetical protein
MQKQQKQTTTEFLNTFVPYCTHALTLQMCLPTLNASDERMDRLYERATRTTRQFVRRFAYEAFGNGITRKPNLYHPLIITAIEGTLNTYDKNRTLHAHIALGNVLTPQSKIKTEAQLRQTIKDEWLKTRDGINNIDIQLMHSNGWITYITKEMQNGNMECVDWQNCHIPYAALSL